MFEPPFDWNSFWDLTSPAEAAATFREIYGPAAARNDDRENDHRFWVAVSAELIRTAETASQVADPHRH
jgi:hypothetical protein